MLPYKIFICTEHYHRNGMQVINIGIHYIHLLHCTILQALACLPPNVTKKSTSFQIFQANLRFFLNLFIFFNDSVFSVLTYTKN